MAAIVSELPKNAFAAKSYKMWSAQKWRQTEVLLMALSPEHFIAVMLATA